MTDEALLEAAARVVARRGPHAFTLADVAREVGVTASAVAQRFGSKRALLLALAARGARDVADAFARARKAGAPLDALLDAFGALAGTPTPQEAANGLAFLALDVVDAEFRGHARAWFAAAEREAHALLDAAVAARDLRPRTDTAALARAVLAAYNGALVAWALTQEGTAKAGVRDAVLAVVEPHRSVAGRLT